MILFLMNQSINHVFKAKELRNYILLQYTLQLNRLFKIYTYIAYWCLSQNIV